MLIGEGRSRNRRKLETPFKGKIYKCTALNFEKNFFICLLVREWGRAPLSHHPASQKLLKVFVRQCASIDRKITKLYENPEKPPNPTEMFSIFFGIKRLGPRSTHTISHPNFSENFFESKSIENFKRNKTYSESDSLDRRFFVKLPVVDFRTAERPSCVV